MTADFIEMCAYQAMHFDGGPPWRCVLCESLTRHTDEGIMPHLVDAHNALAAQIRTELDGMFLYPNPTKETQCPSQA